MIEDLIFIDNEVPPLFSVSGDRGAGHGKFYSEIEFDGGVDNCIKAEDLLDAVGVLGVSSHTDPGIAIMRQLGTPKAEV